MRYRILGVTDIIRCDDEIDACHDNWHDDAVWRKVSECSPHLIGKHPSDPRYPAHTLFRRFEQDIHFSPAWDAPKTAEQILDDVAAADHIIQTDCNA